MSLGMGPALVPGFSSWQGICKGDTSHFLVCELGVCEQAGFTSHGDGKRARLTTRQVLCRERADPGSGLTRATIVCSRGRKVGHKVDLPWSQVRRLRQAGKLAAEVVAGAWHGRG